MCLLLLLVVGVEYGVFASRSDGVFILWQSCVSLDVILFFCFTV